MELLNDFIDTIKNDNKDLKSDIEYYKRQNKRIKEQNKRLKEKINNAIEKLDFMDEALDNHTFNLPLCIVKINKALEILRGENNEC